MCIFIIEIVAASSFRCNSHVDAAIHLRTLSSGGFHPEAQCPKLLYSQKDVHVCDPPLMSISGSRLALIIDSGAVGLEKF